MGAYDASFYADRDARTRYAADRVLSLALDLLPPVRSAVDVGCGVGTWLSVLLERGVPAIQGLDGAWVDPGLLVIPRETFLATDLGGPLPDVGRFDLAISLEVAEHLPRERADGFVASLTGLSDFVLFSAAIPHQGGSHHVNEQWQDYWAQLFARRGYAVLDAIRPRIWSDDRIAFWYRQNVLVYVKKERLGDLRIPQVAPGSSPIGPLRVVHPEQYLRKIPDGAAAGWKMLRRGLRASLARSLGRRSTS
jgi:SAM-dependent methyltransferase